MDIVIRAALMFLFLFALTRIVGRRELSSMQPFDLILLIIMGDLAQQAVTQNDQSLTGAVLVFSVFVLFTVGLSFLAAKFRPLVPILEGRPLVLVEDGEPLRRNLRKERLTVGDLESEARLQQIDGLDKVRLAILETNGRISFLTD